MVVKKNWWENNRNKVYWTLDLISAALSPFITFQVTNHLFLSILSIIFGPLLVNSIITMFDFNIMYPKLRAYIGSGLGLLKDVATLIDAAHQLDSKKRGVSLTIAIDSLNSLTKNGLIKVDVPYYDFLDYIKDLSEGTSKIIFGTSALRRPIDLAKDNFSRNYLQALLSDPKRRLVRITVLTDEDLRAIVTEALVNLISKAGGATTFINDIPEIEWWVTWANQVDYKTTMKPNIQLEAHRILLWTTHSIALREINDNALIQSATRPGTIDDYAVFDNQVVIKFRENRDVQMGILFVIWGELVNQYTIAWSKIEQALATGPSITLADLGLFASFYDLLYNSNLTLDISSYPIISSHFKGPNAKLCDVYEKIIDLVKNGKAEFNNNYLKLFK